LQAFPSTYITAKAWCPGNNLVDDTQPFRNQTGGICDVWKYLFDPAGQQAGT
jgi:hypothetical protein